LITSGYQNCFWAGDSSLVDAELILYGVILGSIIALGSIGLSLLYGIVNFPNFAHGDIMTLGAISPICLPHRSGCPYGLRWF